MTRCQRCQRRLPPSGECRAHGKPTAIADVAEHEPPPTPQAPRGWRVGSLLAVGGSAYVYQVRQETSPPAVMKLARWPENELRMRFDYEASVLRTVGPPATPALIEAGDLDGHAYLIMEHLPGETLAAWMSRFGDRGGLGEIVAILTRVASALAGLHAKSFVHRDLKPENIMIGAKGVRLLDFGLVKTIRPATRTRSLTQIGSIVGTPHYLAPEQIKPGSQLDHRADLYSLGVVAYEMLTGTPPFTGERRAIEYNHTVGRPPPIGEFRSVPGPLEEIVMSCLAKQPDARPATAEALREALSSALTQLGTLRGVVAPVEPRADSRPIGTHAVVALAWIDRADPVAVTRAIMGLNGIVVGQRGEGILAAFSAQQHDSPLQVALAACRPLLGERRRIALHVTTALVRRSQQGKPMVYGTDVEQTTRWLPTVPFTGMVLTAAAAQALPGVVPAADVSGFFREQQRDRTDATDAKVESPLVGRDGLIRTLIDAAMEHDSVLVGISGSSGSGKSRVLRAVADRLESAGRPVVRFSGRRRFPGDRRDDDRFLAALGGGPQVSDALADLAARGAILVIDDLQWLSPGVRRLVLEPPAPLIRFVTSPEPAFEVMDFAADRISVELPSLTFADADALIRELLRPARLIPAALVERLVFRGMGNPGMLIGLALDIKRRGAVRRQLGAEEWYVAVDELDTLLAPPGPSWFANRLLEELPSELVPIVRLCAGLGPKFSAAEVAHVTGARDVETRLPLLVREGMFVERNGSFEFVDAAIQEAIYDHVLDERELVHRRALAFWVESTDRNVVGRLARVAYHAAGAGDRTLALTCWWALARRAAREGGSDDADELLAYAIARPGSGLPPRVAEALADLVE